MKENQKANITFRNYGIIFLEKNQVIKIMKKQEKERKQTLLEKEKNFQIK